MENERYGIGIANRYELFYDQDDVTTDFETVITKKKKSKEPAQQTQTPSPATGVQQKSVAEKENKQVKKATLDNGTGQPKVTPDQQQRRGIKEQQNNSNKEITSTVQRKDGGKFMHISRSRCRSTRALTFFLLWKILGEFSSFRVNDWVCAKKCVSRRKIA